MFVRKYSSFSPLYFFILNSFLKVVSSDNTYNIGSANDFINFISKVNDGSTSSDTTVYLTNDIDFNSYSSAFEPTGKANSVYCFSGTFNGQGHAIKNLAVDSSDFRYTALFGHSNGLTIKNVVIDKSCSFSSSYSGTYNDAYASSVIGHCEVGTCNIENVVNMADISYRGGTSKGYVIAGGIIAKCHGNCVLRNCVNFGSVTLSSTNTAGYIHAGGVIGEIDETNTVASIRNCINYGTVTNSIQGSNVYMGGIAGIIHSNTAIDKCLSAGPLSSVVVLDNTYVGSVVGSTKNSYSKNNTITNCFWTESVGNYNVCGGVTVSSTALTIAGITYIEMGESSLDTLYSTMDPDDSHGWVIVHLNGGRIGNSSYDNLIVNKVVKCIPEPVREGSAFKFWCTDTGCSATYSSNAMDECDSKELYAVWDRANVVFLTLDDNNNTINRTLSFGDVIEYPEGVEKTGYTLSGWDNTTATAPGYDIVVSAIWSVNNYTVTFEFDNGAEAEKRTFTYNTVIDFPEDPTKDGHSFISWNDTTITTMPAYNLTIKALWIANNYSVTFDFDNGTEPEERTFVYNALIEYLEDPMKEGHSFINWNVTSITIMPAYNLTIKALWIANNYTVTFDFDNGTEAEERIFTYNTVFEYPEDPKKEGHSFINWNVTSISTIPAYNLTIKALWIANNYSVTFDFDNGTEPEERTFVYNALIEYLEDPMKEGHSFINWNVTSITIMPAYNLTIKALWIANNYTVTFDFDNGTEAEKKTFTYNTEVTYPDNPTKEGYSFVNWNNTSITVMPAYNLTIKALWFPNNYTVTFNATGGTAPSPLKREVTYGEQYGELPETTRTGYTLAGWFTGENGNGESIDFDTNVTIPNNHTLYAYWTINNYSVTFEFDNGAEAEKRSFVYNTVIDFPEDPKKDGSIFFGWDNNVTVMPAHNLVIKAKWTTNPTSQSNSVEIVFGTVDLTDKEVEDIVNELASNVDYEIVRISRDNEGEIRVIVRFVDVETATNFVETISASSNKNSYISGVGFIDDRIVSLSFCFIPVLAYYLFL